MARVRVQNGNETFEREVITSEPIQQALTSATTLVRATRGFSEAAKKKMTVSSVSFIRQIKGLHE